MNNQGLEALAALASSVSASGNTNSNDSTSQGSVSSRQGLNHSSNASGNRATTQAAELARAVQLLQSAQNTSPQQWQQALSAVGGITSNASPQSFPSSNLGLLASLQQLTHGDQAAALAALQQQLSGYQRLMQSQSQSSNSAAQTLGGNNGALDAAQAMQFAFGAQHQHPFSQLADNRENSSGVRQVLPQGQNQPTTSNEVNKTPTNATGPRSNSMPPPPSSVAGPASQPVAVSTSGMMSPHNSSQLQAIAPQPTSESDADLHDHNAMYEVNSDKKQQKRAANRRSAQLSRKRKKQFIEELKEENDDLRRKEQILKSIPDLVVVFDSSGKLWFVSQSVSRFLDFTSKELEGTSFWNRLCDDSVRLLKAAFMDSLAARNADSDTAPLGSGFWELRLVDKDGTQKVVTLNGVVHFAGDRPECVCSIRPQDDQPLQPESTAKKELSREKAAGTPCHKSQIRVKPQQSVVSTHGCSDSSSSSHRVQRRPGKDAVRISDSGNSSGSSDSGSSDDANQ